MPGNQAEHTSRTPLWLASLPVCWSGLPESRSREAYDRLAAVWSSTTDEGPFNGHLERPVLRALVPDVAATWTPNWYPIPGGCSPSVRTVSLPPGDPRCL